MYIATYCSNYGTGETIDEAIQALEEKSCENFGYDISEIVDIYEVKRELKVKRQYVEVKE